MASKKKISTSTDNSMKVVLIVALALAFIAGYLVSRARYKPQILELNKMVLDKDTTISNLKANANKFMREDDVMWIVEDGLVRELEEEVTLSNGYVVTPEGKVMKGDGSEMMLQNGESMGMDGELIVNEGSVMESEF